MLNIENELNKLAAAEEGGLSHYKIENNSDILLVTFGYWTSVKRERYFCLKTSSLNLSNEIPIDILYVRGKSTWYLGDLVGIGNGVDEIKSFFSEQIKNYKKVIFVGVSMGGYGAILYGSLCGVDCVFAYKPQTDLEYPLKFLPKNRDYRRISCYKDYRKYKNLNKIISSKTQYYIASYLGKCTRNMKKGDRWEMAQHDYHHFENIDVGNNVNFIGDIVENPFENCMDLVKEKL